MTAQATDPRLERRGGARVLLASQHPADPNALGGVEIHLADLAQHVGPEVEPFAAYLRAGKLVLEAFRPVRREIVWFPADDLAAAFRAALLATGAQVLHVHSPQLGPEALARAARASGARVLLTLHDAASSRAEVSPLPAAADLVIAPSRFIRDLVAEAHPEAAARTRLIHWGVPPQERVRPRPAGRLRVAVVGVLAAEKGAERLPALMRATAHLGLEWHLFGATEGRSLAAVRRAAPDLRAHGAYRRSELGRWLAKAEIDVALLPSIVPEAFCMTLSECISARGPVVASDLGALAERVHDERCGWTFDPWRPASLAEVLEPLGDRRELARVARRLECLHPRSPAAMAAEHTAVYLELAAIERAGSDPALAGVAAQPPRGKGKLRRTWRAFRQSRFYRDLPLRGLLSEDLRGRVEQRAAALLDRLRR